MKLIIRILKSYIAQTVLVTTMTLMLGITLCTTPPENTWYSIVCDPTIDKNADCEEFQEAHADTVTEQRTAFSATSEVVYHTEIDGIKVNYTDNLTTGEVIYDTNVDAYKGLLITAAQINDLDPKLAIAISALETGWWTSDLFVNGHNFGGITRNNTLETYGHEVDGLEDYVDCLVWYRDHGKTTPEAMASAWCPENENWANSVRQIMEEL